MSPSKSSVNVEQIAKMLNVRKITRSPATVLFLGSRTGGLFRHRFLAELLEGFGDPNLSKMKPIERFHQCYNILAGFKKDNLWSDIHGILNKALQEIRIEVADTCVAELMKQRIFDFIITTNIGSELELAFIQNGMQAPRDFEVIPGPGGSIAGKLTKNDSFKMIKASGDVASRSYSICGYNIDSEELYLGKYPELKTSIQQVKEEDMLMVGFDYKWDDHILQTIFPRNRGSLWYVNEKQTTENSQLSSYLQACQAKRLEDTQGRYELFFTDLCWHVLGIIPTNQKTLDKLTSIEQMLHEMRDRQHQFQNEVNRLVATVDKLLQYQEPMMKGIKEDIKRLNTSVDSLKRSTSPLLDSSSTLSPDSVSTLQETKQRSPKNREQLEENRNELF